MMMTAEMVVHTDCGMSIKAVLALSAMVNTVINNPVERMIVSGLRQLLDHRDHHKMTGNTGNTHGARMLSSHAMKERMERDIILS